MIHPSASIDPTARLAPDVTVGPWSIVGPGVEIGAGSRIGSHTLIHGPTRIQSDNSIGSFCDIGGDPQDKKYAGETQSVLEIGSGNTIREYVSINRGTYGGGGVTRVGDGNWIMAHVHVAHDCTVGNHAVLSNCVQLAGHVVVEDHANLAGIVGVLQFCRVGAYSFVAAGSIVRSDVPPFVLASGHKARAVTLNTIGLRRNGFSARSFSVLKQAFRILYRRGLSRSDAITALEVLAEKSPHAGQFLEFVRTSRRGLIRGTGEPAAPSTPTVAEGSSDESEVVGILPASWRIAPAS